MKFLFVVWLVLSALLLFLTSAIALDCYNCVYLDGNSLSDAECENTPKNETLNTCSGTKSTAHSSKLNPNVQIKKGQTIMFGLGVAQRRQADFIPMCAKISGKISSKNVLARMCGYGNKDLDETCTSDGISLTVKNENATDVTGCFCSKDICNTANSLKISNLPRLFIEVWLCGFALPFFINRIYALK